MYKDFGNLSTLREEVHKLSFITVLYTTEISNLAQVNVASIYLSLYRNRLSHIVLMARY